jgi:hypothetical protein
MKYRSWHVIAGFVILMTFLYSCGNSGKDYLQNILKPGAMPFLRDSKLMQVSSHTAKGEKNNMIMIPAGKSETILQVPGPGVITHICFRIDSNDPWFLRRILIKMFWDKETNPSVEVPFGDFFGSGFSFRPYSTPYIGMSDDGYTFSFPMPFNEQARIVIVNETGQDIRGFYYRIDYQKTKSRINKNLGYLNAYWHRDVNTDYDSDYTILNTTGRGYIVCVNMSIQSYSKRLSYPDGNAKVFADGEKLTLINGAGTEDYFSIGRYFSKQEFANPYSGLVLKDDSLARISVYRFHIEDPVRFKKSINFMIEHGFNNKDIADYSSTVYWYQTEPHVKFPPVPKAGMRIPLRLILPTNMIEAEQQKFNIGKIRTEVMDMSDYGADWSGSKQLLIESGPKDEFSLFLSHLEETGYDIRIYYTRGPQYGNVDVLLGSEKVGEIDGYASFVQPGGYLSIPDFMNLYNGIPLKFIVTGRDSLSTGYSIGLDGFSLEPKRTFIREWNVIGPFADKIDPMNPRTGIDSVYPPEIAFDRNQTCKGLNGKYLHWQILETGTDGFLSFDNLTNPEEPAIFYAIVFIQSSEPRFASLLIGSQNSIKIIYNLKGYRQRPGRTLSPDQERYLIKINRGWNRLLIKIEVREGRAGFYARIPDREGLFHYATIQYHEAKNPVIRPYSKKRK